MIVYPAGTNDFNVASTNWFAQGGDPQPDGSVFEQLQFTAPTDGSMPMNVHNCLQHGDYSFTASVAHRLNAYLASPFQDARHHKTYYAVRAYDGDGQRVAAGLKVGLQGKDAHGHWVWWQSTASGPYNFFNSWPARMRGQWWTVRAVVSGLNWATAYSPPLRVKGV